MPSLPPIVLVHGLWMTPKSWDTWASRFRQAGHEVIAPGWPGIDDRSPADVRRDPGGLAGLGIKAIVDSYESVIRALPESPIIMGHSFGGLFAQLLADRGLGVAVVGVAPGQPAGIKTLPFSTLRSGFTVLRNPFAKGKASPISKGHFHYTFGNDLTRAESDQIWEEQAVPSSNRVFFEGVAATLNEKKGVSRVDWANPNRAPLLLMTGEKDHVVPHAIGRAITKRYQKAGGPGLVEHREYAGKTHRLVSQDGWEVLADEALEWAMSHRRS